MKLRKIWVLPLLLTLVCSVGCGGKADLLHGYEKVVSSMGSLARTSEHKLIGTRTCGSDNYTGAYAAVSGTGKRLHYTLPEESIGIG